MLACVLNSAPAAKNLMDVRVGRILIAVVPPLGEPSCKAVLRPRGIRQILGGFL